MISLCAFCKKRNGSKLPECGDGKCHVCRGACAKLREMIGEAAGKIPEEWKSFAISTGIPRDMMGREEEVWDSGLGESMKSDFNRRIVGALVEKTGLDYDVLKADGKITFDFRNFVSESWPSERRRTDIGKGEVRIANSDIFIFGRYKKFRTDLAQTEWTCKKCRGKGCGECDFEGVKYESVEAIIGKCAKEIYGARDAELHSSGREDVDALNLAGRPFVLELRKPANGKMKNENGLEILRDKINNPGKGDSGEGGEGVEIGDLRYVSNSEVALVSDSHFDKAYEAEIEVGGGLAGGDEEKILRLKGTTLRQRTPHRVKHRRSDLVRKRKILDLQILGKNPPKLYVLAEAGTYIKEFIGGDEGRTEPSIAQVLGKKAKCIKLSVVEIHDDFLRERVEGK